MLYTRHDLLKYMLALHSVIFGAKRKTTAVTAIIVIVITVTVIIVVIIIIPITIIR
jgi:hypothetical protein